jgi:hypothetical protein
MQQHYTISCPQADYGRACGADSGEGSEIGERSAAIMTTAATAAENCLHRGWWTPCRRPRSSKKAYLFSKNNFVVL